MKRMYQVYDLEAGLVSGPIMTEHNDTVAVRHFKSIFTIPNSMPQKYPEHFELRCLGVQDEESGAISVHNPHITIYDGNNYLADIEKSAAIQQARAIHIDKGER